MNGTVLFTGNWRNRHQPPPITRRVVCFVCVLIRCDRRLVGLRVFIKSISLSTKFTQSARFRIRSKNNSTLLFSGKRAQASVEHSKRAQRARSKSHEGCKRRFFTRILQNCFFEFASQCPCHRVRSTPSVNRLPSQRFKNASHRHACMYGYQRHSSGVFLLLFSHCVLTLMAHGCHSKKRLLRSGRHGS